MITYNPSGVINLVKVPLDKDYEHQLTFENLSSQTNYFNTQVLRRVYEDYTYIKKDNVIKVNDLIDDIEQYNYLYYYNSSTGKRFYCFIDKMEYIGNQCTAIYFSTDVIQTYLFDMDLSKHSLIEREHVSDDTEGKNIVPEDIDTGEYIEEYHQNSEVPSAELVYIVALRSFVFDTWTYTPSSENVPNGLYYTAFKTVNGVRKFIEYLNAGIFKHLVGDEEVPYTSEEIYAVFLGYKGNFSNFVNFYEPGTQTVIDQLSFTPTFIVQGTMYAPDWTSSINYRENGSDTIQTYNIRNKKLKCYPYQFLQVDNKVGEIVQFHYEDFYRNRYDSVGDITFYSKYCLSIGSSGLLYPINYRTFEENPHRNSYVVNLQKMPIGSWVTDAYVNWMTQNSVNLGFTTIDPTKWGLISAGYNLLNGNYGSDRMDNVEGYYSNVFNVFQQKYKAQLLPDNVGGNAGNGDINGFSLEYGVRFSRMTLKIENLKRIDDYFDKYGYRVNVFKPINLHKRYYWDFIKTGQCNIESLSSSYIPQEYLSKIKSIFNKGITFWHNQAYFLDYTRNNNIIS